MDERNLQQRIYALPQTDNQTDRAILEKRKLYPRFMIRWGSKENDILNELVKANYTNEQIAHLLKRSNYAIKMQKEKLRLNSSFFHQAQAEKTVEAPTKKTVETPTTKVTYTPFRPHKNSTLNLIHYWRSSLADTEKMGINTQQVERKGKQFSEEAIQQGKLVWPELAKIFLTSDKQTTDNSENHTNSYNHDTPQQNKLPVIIVPFAASKILDYGKAIDQPARDRATTVFPLWIAADITREGKLIPCEINPYPWIARECLTPNEKNYSHPIIGDISQVDNFYMQNNQLLNQENLQWKTVLAFAFDLLEAVAGKELSELLLAQHYQLKWSGYVLPSNLIRNSTIHITRIYDEYLLDKHKKIPTLLQKFCSIKQQQHKCYEVPTTRFIATKSRLHLGQMQNQYPLSISQRISLSYFFDDKKDSPIFTVNGPPGTGKTSLLLSVIASKWVNAAIERKSPPIIVAASTNNLAVTNILDCFIRVCGNASTNFSMRWLPNLNSYGLYLPSIAKANEARKHGYLYRTKEKNSGNLEDFYTADYHQQAKDYFLKQFNAYYQTNLSSLVDCQNRLHQQLLEKKALIEKTAALINKYFIIHENGIQSLEAIDKMLAKQQYHETVEKTQLNQFNALKLKWLRYASEHIGWSLVPACFSAKRQTLVSEKIQNFLTEHHDFFSEPLRLKKVKAIRKQLNRKIAEQTQKYVQIQQRQQELVTLKQAYEQFSHDKMVLQQQLNVNFEIDDVFNYSENSLLAKLDKALRYDLFLLATHYWEAEWLLESPKINNLPENKLGQEKYWHIQAMMAPCFVTTLHSGPAFFQYKNVSQESASLVDFIDLLIIDEAGQVMPAIAGAMISLAKKALLVGDIKQIEPVFSLPASIDFANSKKFNLCKNKEAYEALKSSGILCSGDSSTGHAYGNVILVGQRKSAHHLHAHELPGMLLKEHRRCAKEIIAYCNELCYNNQLIPMTEERNCAYPRIGYAHVKGFQQKIGASRCNQDEAEVIAYWLKKNEEKILKTCGNAKSLDECVGIITPFLAQADEIKNALKRQELTIKKVGTVHTMQGAEKDIVIFSPVYTADEQAAQFFFDRSPNMLNVAVSRAKMSFLVFGDMDIFDQSKPYRPSGLLAKYLFSQEDNEIVDIIQPKFLRINEKEVIQIITLEGHRAMLKQAFELAMIELNIVSPYISLLALQNDRILELIKTYSQKIMITIYSDPTLNEKNHVAFTQAIKLLQQAGANVMLADRVHSKVLAVDNRIIVGGSFNWLSASRTDNRFIRDELSYRHEGAYVAKFIQDALTPIRNKAKPFKMATTETV